MKNNSLRLNALYSIVHRTTSIVFPLVSTAYVSRVLFAEGVGRISAVNNNVSYFLILSSLGIPAYGLREISKNRENSNARSQIYSELFLINLLLTAITSILFIVLLFNVGYFQREKYLYYIYGVTIVLNVFNIEWLFQGLEEYGYIAIRSTIIKIVSFILVIALVKEKNDIYLYAIIQVGGTAVNYILNMINTRKYIDFSICRFNNISQHFKPLLYLALCSVSTELYAKMDITMLDIMHTSNSVGCYAYSQKIVNLIVTFLVAITAVFMPRLSFLFYNRRNEFSRVIQKGFSLMVTISIPSWIGLIIVSKTLVATFLGPDFTDADLLVRILSAMVPLKCIGDLICYQVMMCAGKEEILMKSYFIIMVVNFINNIVLIPVFAAEGAAIASVISEILAFIFVLYFSRSYFKLSRIKLMLIKTMLCSTLMGIVVYLFNNLRCSNYIKLVIEISAGIFVYLVSCMFVKQEVVMDYFTQVKKNGRVD